ncbi:hypothetical protein V1505DRAFT_144413 [Lipomyces doorenjongii]
MWAYFETTEYNRPWIMKRTKSKRIIDRDIRCIYIDEQTGIRCHRKTTDSARQTSTSNMARHLQKHSIYPPDSSAEASGTNKQPSIATFFNGKQNLTVKQLLEKNILRWIVTEKQAFTTIESPAFSRSFVISRESTYLSPRVIQFGSDFSTILRYNVSNYKKSLILLARRLHYRSISGLARTIFRS